MNLDHFILPLILLLPVMGGALLTQLAKDRNDWVRSFAMMTSIVTFALSVIAFFYFQFVDSARAIQLNTEIGWFDTLGLTFKLGVDEISLWLILLTTFLTPLVIWGSFNSVKERAKEFYMWLLFLEAAMLGVFVARDIIFFYISFEFTLVPMYFLIGIFGGTQRLKAAKVFFLYTFTGSMLTFAGVLYVAWWHSTVYGHWTFDITSLVTAATDAERGLSQTQQVWVMLSMLAGFAVKVPIFPVHTWLPLAHTEAPTSGSVILAGVLLKLGTFALIRLAIPIVPDGAIIFAPYLGMLAVAGIFYAALICWVQKDIKKLIAYSSVSHLGFCVLGMFALNMSGLSGSVLYMINHGLSTGALFLLVGMIYERFHTREMSKMQGLGRVMPIWASFMVFFCLSSVGLPGLNGFVGEFLTLKGAFETTLMGPIYALLAGTGLIFGAIYILYMVGKVVFGPVIVPGHDGDADGHGHGHTGGHSGGHSVSDLNFRETAILLILAVPCVWIGLYPNTILNTLEKPVAAITEAAGTNTDEPIRRIDLPLPMDSDPMIDTTEHGMLETKTTLQLADRSNGTAPLQLMAKEEN